MLQTYCPDCLAPIFARYDLPMLEQELKPVDFRSRARGMWRWHELLPVSNSSNVVHLGEGDTPLLPLPNLGAQFRLRNLFIKDESVNPTGTFKARGLSSAVSKAKELGVRKLIIPTAGNAGSALAAYAAHAGIQATVVLPANSPNANFEEIRIYGARAILIDGSISAAAKLTRKKCREDKVFDLSTFREPYRVEGKKIMGYELAEQFNWKLPDVIIYPTGGGTGLVGMWKAFDEIQMLKWVTSKSKPRMVAIQSEGCAPLVKAYDDGKLFCDEWIEPNTIATGLCVPKSFADKRILQIIRESDGVALAVSDDEIFDAQSRLASKEGIFTSPEGAATLAGLIKLIDKRLIDPKDNIVIFNTGTGLKYLT